MGTRRRGPSGHASPVPPWLIVAAALTFALLVGVVMTRSPGLGVAAAVGVAYVPLVLLSLPLGISLWVATVSLSTVTPAPNLAGIVLLFGWLGAVATGRTRLASLSRVHRRVLLLTGALVLWVLLTMAWAPQSVLGGEVFFNWLVVVAIMCVVSTTVVQRRHLQWVAAALVVGVVVSVVLGATGGVVQGGGPHALQGGSSEPAAIRTPSRPGSCRPSRSPSRSASAAAGGRSGARRSWSPWGSWCRVSSGLSRAVGWSPPPPPRSLHWCWPSGPARRSSPARSSRPRPLRQPGSPCTRRVAAHVQPRREQRPYRAVARRLAHVAGPPGDGVGPGRVPRPRARLRLRARALGVRRVHRRGAQARAQLLPGGAGRDRARRSGAVHGRHRHVRCTARGARRCCSSAWATSRWRPWPGPRWSPSWGSCRPRFYLSNPTDRRTWILLALGPALLAAANDSAHERRHHPGRSVTSGQRPYEVVSDR